MKALVFYAPADCRIEEVKNPSLGSGDILVGVKYAGVCGTDVRIYQGTKKIKPPRITGHEFAGEIVEVGREVTGYRVGERVTVYPVLFCGKCYACRRGRKNICLNRITLGYELDGGFSEYIKIPEKAVKDRNVITLPENITYEEGAASEPVAAAYNGIVRADIRSGDSIVIAGAGPIGLCHVMLSKIKEPGKIIVSEPDRYKRELALRLGANVGIDPTDTAIPVKDNILNLTNGEGADVVFVDVGIKKVLEEALGFLKKGGTYILFAGCPEGTSITIDPNVIHYKEIRFTGASASTPEYQREILSLMASETIDVKPLITDVIPLDSWRTAFEMKENHKGLKSILRI